MADITVSTFVESIGGRPVVVKHRLANPHTDQPLLAERQTELEGRWLNAARHQNVVRLRRALPTEAALATDHAGLHTLATCRHPPMALAVVLSVVAQTLADLHSRGLVHGRLTASHVILRGPDLVDPVLCSPSPDVRADRPRPRVDVEALAALAADLMGCEVGPVGRDRAWAGWSAAIEALADADVGVSALGAFETFTSLARGPRRGLLRGLVGRG